MSASRGDGAFTLALALALGLFILGILQPMMIIHPGFGDHSNLVAYLYPELSAPRVVTLWGGLQDLWQQGSVGLACLLGLFSLVLPGVKFTACLLAISGRHVRLLVRFVHAFGYMSMAEVVFVSVLALTLKSLPGGTHVERGVGLWIFFASVLLLSAITAWLHRRHEGDGASPSPEP